MTNSSWETFIREAYTNVEGNRTTLWLMANLMREAGELAELEIKFQGYGKEFKHEEILSEAGDVLNFLTMILIRFGYTLDDAKENNIKKLKERGWL